MPKESRSAKRARKAAAKAAARTRAARIVAGEIPDYLRMSNTANDKPRSSVPRHTVVQTPPEQPAKALIPPADAPLRPLEREHYADNAPAVWVKGGHLATDD